MAFEIYIALVTFVALVYACIARFIQNKMIDRKEMEAIQKESRDLSAAYEKASKAKDKKKMDEILQQQMDFLPRMNKAMMGQFKPMFIILIVFALFTGLVTQIDPTVKDDIHLNLTDDGRGCDRVAGDGIFSGCYHLDPANTNYGKWTITANIYENGANLGHNQTYFLYNPNPDNADTYTERGVGEAMQVLTDKMQYAPGGNVSIYVVPANMTAGSSFLFIQTAAPRQMHIDHVEAVLSNGTYFRVDLPFSIPIVNIDRIYQPYTWFIMISLIANLTLSFAMSQYERMQKAKAEGSKGKKD